jgi:hypothetical protein
MTRSSIAAPVVQTYCVGIAIRKGKRGGSRAAVPPIAAGFPVFPVETGNFIDFPDKPASRPQKRGAKSSACERIPAAMPTGDSRGPKRELNSPNRELSGRMFERTAAKHQKIEI